MQILKYRILEYLKKLTVEEFKKAEQEIPPLLKVSKHHFKYFICKYTLEDTGTINTDQVWKIMDYLNEHHSDTLGVLTFEDMMNRPIPKKKKIRRRKKQQTQAA